MRLTFPVTLDTPTIVVRNYIRKYIKDGIIPHDATIVHTIRQSSIKYYNSITDKLVVDDIEPTICASIDVVLRMLYSETCENCPMDRICRNSANIMCGELSTEILNNIEKREVNLNEY